MRDATVVTVANTLNNLLENALGLLLVEAPILLTL